MAASRNSTGAVLAGSLAAFGLLDVLELLSRTRHTGALQVVGDAVDEHLWVDAGDLLERSDVAAERLFTLASLHEAWFTVTPGPPPRSLAAGDRVALEPLIALVAPRVEEWGSLVRNLPGDAVVKMASTTPGPEVQIRAEQWHILAVVGTGRTVREIVDAAGAPPLDTLRVVQQLLDQHLVAVLRAPPPPTAGPETAPEPPSPATAPPDADPAPALDATGPASPPTAAPPPRAGPSAAVSVPLAAADNPAPPAPPAPYMPPPVVPGPPDKTRATMPAGLAPGGRVASDQSI